MDKQLSIAVLYWLGVIYYTVWRNPQVDKQQQLLLQFRLHICGSKERYHRFALLHYLWGWFLNVDIPIPLPHLDSLFKSNKHFAEKSQIFFFLESPWLIR